VLLSLVLLAFFARGVQYVYTHYARPAESGLVSVLQYLFTSRDQAPASPAWRGPLSRQEIAGCASGTPPEDYFSTIPSSGENDSVLRKSYSRVLCAMGELPLHSRGTSLARIRLVWLPSFEPALAVRIEHSRTGDQVVVTHLKETGKGLRWADSLEVDRSTEQWITGQQWTRLQSLVDETGFWSSHTVDFMDGIGTMDGAAWLIEISEPTRYHMVHRINGLVLAPLVEYVRDLSRGAERPSDQLPGGDSSGASRLDSSRSKE
jgi:hypothetical protein